MSNRVLLGEIAESQTGPFGSQLHEEDYVEEGTPIVTVEHLGELGFTKQNLPLVSDEDVQRLNKYTLKEGDIVFSRVGSIDRNTYVTKDENGWMFSGRCIRVRCDKNKVNPLYLSYYFRQEHFKRMMLNVSVGATMPSLNTDIMDSLPIDMAEKSEQDRIAKCLALIDDKIRNNTAICAELEAMAKLIYDYWFVQFDFPDENGKPYKSSGGKMVWNEELKREIPAGWEVKFLSEVFDITMGSSPSGDSLNIDGDGIEFYQGSTDFGYLYPSIRVFTTEPIRFAKAKDVLISVRAPVGDMNIAMNDCCIGRGLAAIHHESTLYAWCTMLTFKPYFDIYNGSGTTFGALTSDDLRGQLTALPPEKILTEFMQKVDDVSEKLKFATIESQQLAALRDFLLPMLMNGQVKVSGR